MYCSIRLSAPPNPEVAVTMVLSVVEIDELVIVLGMSFITSSTFTNVTPLGINVDILKVTSFPEVSVLVGPVEPGRKVFSSPSTFAY